MSTVMNKGVKIHYKAATEKFLTVVVPIFNQLVKALKNQRVLLRNIFLLENTPLQ